MKTWTLTTLLFIWLGGLGGGFLLGGREPAISHALAAAQNPTAQTEAGPAGPAGSNVNISEEDFKLVPNKVTAKAGLVTFVLANNGRYTHDFRVEGQGIDDRAPRIGAGFTHEFKVTLKPGAYRISCPISNHAKRGMTGTLVVVGG